MQFVSLLFYQLLSQVLRVFVRLECSQLVSSLTISTRKQSSVTLALILLRLHPINRSSTIIKQTVLMLILFYIARSSSMMLTDGSLLIVDLANNWKILCILDRTEVEQKWFGSRSNPNKRRLLLMFSLFALTTKNILSTDRFPTTSNTLHIDLLLTLLLLSKILINQTMQIHLPFIFIKIHLRITRVERVHLLHIQFQIQTLVPPSFISLFFLAFRLHPGCEKRGASTIAFIDLVFHI